MLLDDTMVVVHVDENRRRSHDNNMHTSITAYTEEVCVTLLPKETENVKVAYVIVLTSVKMGVAFSCAW
jgi:N-acetylmuramic acid 6-phosphate (MurNAc-6-P) etherase